MSSLADISLNTWSTSADPTRIPEVRHNIKLIAEACKSDLDGLAREAKALAEKKKWIASEDARLRKKVDDEAERKLFSDHFLSIFLIINSYRPLTTNTTGGQRHSDHVKRARKCV